jgi:hypothetical protein
VDGLTGEPGRPGAVIDAPRPADCPQVWTHADRGWDRLRYTLIIGWLVVLVLAVATGERTTSWSELRSLVASGDVDAVRITGELSGRSTGFATVKVHWRHGSLRHVAEVVQIRGAAQPARAPRGGEEGLPVVRERPSTLLTELQPDLRVTRDRQYESGGQLAGWWVSPPLALGAFMLFVTGLGLLIAGPQPWRATRWGWFWLQLPPIGTIAFLLLAGPTPGLPGPRNEHRRLTGGWALLLCILLAALVASDARDDFFRFR